MRLFNFKTTYKRFHFYTRFYDENQERLDLKRKQYQNLENSNDEERKLIFREQLKDTWHSGKSRNTQSLNYNLRILSLIALILVLGYFILNGLETIERAIYILMD
jgi:hypothetical protein